MIGAVYAWQTMECAAKRDCAEINCDKRRASHEQHAFSIGVATMDVKGCFTILFYTEIV